MYHNKKKVPTRSWHLEADGVDNSMTDAMDYITYKEILSRAKASGHACPICGYPDSFSIRWKGGRALLYSHGCGCTSKELYAHLTGRTAAWTPPERHEPDRATLDAARGILERARPLKGTVAETYLRHRGIDVLPAVGGFRRSLQHTNHLTDERTSWPAMVLPVVNEHDELVACHRTWLALDGSGKAPVHRPKQSLGLIRGGVIKLLPCHGDTLLIGEGIESVLSACILAKRSGMNLPGWSALCSGNLSNIRLPHQIRNIILVMDNDNVGIMEGNKAADTWVAEGRTVKVLPPPDGFNDYNDVVMENSHDCA